MADPRTEPQSVRTAPTGWLGSTILHLGLILCLASVSVSSRSDSLSSLPVRWSLSERDLIDPKEDRLDPPVVFRAQSVGGQSSQTGRVVEQDLVASIRLNSLETLPMAEADTVGMTNLGQQVRPLSHPGRNHGRGEGDGDNRGDGSGSGFFGAERSAQSVVFVVDCSSSMNQPHESEAKTRFRRVKIEMLRSIASMESTAQFYIVFFNNEALPMPASSLQYATGLNKRRYLDWMARLPALGETDPTQAVSIALKLRPQVIYFLTDGRFSYRAEQQLLGLRQNASRIHTFVFDGAEDFAEASELMQQIASNNGGQYHLIR